MLKCGQMKCGYSRLWRLFKQPNTVGISQEIYNLRYIYSHSCTLSFCFEPYNPNKFSNFSFSLFICGDGVAFTLFNNSLWNFRQRFKSSVLSLNFRYFFLFISIMMKISNISHDLMFSCVIVPCWKFVWTNVFPIFCRSARVSISAFFCRFYITEKILLLSEFISYIFYFICLEFFFVVFPISSELNHVNFRMNKIKCWHSIKSWNSNFGNSKCNALYN